MTKDEIKKALEYCTNWRLHCPDCPYFNCSNGNCFDTIKLDALNLITEQEKEIEQLKAENEKRLTCDFVKTAQKQAKIDVLNELKTRHDYAIKNAGYPWDISQQIDELIEEIKNDIFRRTI